MPEGDISWSHTHVCIYDHGRMASAEPSLMLEINQTLFDDD